MKRGNSKTCFVIMPFGEAFDKCHEVLRAEIREAGLKPKRADEGLLGKVTEQIWADIRTAYVCVADVSDANPNVMYELGLAHAIRKPVIPLVQNDKFEKLPFDVQGQRFIKYDCTEEGLRELAREFRKTLKRVILDPEQAVILKKAITLPEPDPDFLFFFGKHCLDETGYPVVFLDAELPALPLTSSEERDSPVRVPCGERSQDPRLNDLILCHPPTAVRNLKHDEPRPKGIRQVFPFRELELVLLLEKLFRQNGGSVILRKDDYSDDPEKVIWPRTGLLSLGLGFNNLTISLGKPDLFKVHYDERIGPHRTDDFIVFKEEYKYNPKDEIAEIDSEKIIEFKSLLKNSEQYALFARVLRETAVGHEPTPYLVCAGHTADGTAAACHFLVKNWKELVDKQRDKLTDQSMVVVIAHPTGKRTDEQRAVRTVFKPYPRF
jgi:hypothetical protein